MKKFLIIAIMALSFIGCDANWSNDSKETTKNGISAGDARANLVVKKQSDGMTVEQANIVKSYEVENRPGSIKHLYVISAYTGQVIIYSTVAGKVTSNAKSLNPSTVTGLDGQNISASHYGIPVDIQGKQKYTTEVMNESGSYGTSNPPYIYWWDTRGVYHQHYIVGGQITHITDQPMVVRDVIINMNLTTENSK